MLKEFLIVVLTTLLFANLKAQTLPVQVDSSNFKINSIGSPEIIIDIFVRLDSKTVVDDENFSTLNSELTLTLISAKYEELIDKSVTISGSPIQKGVRLTINGFSSQLSELIAKNDAEIYIRPNKPIKFDAYNQSDNSSIRRSISIDDIELYTKNKIALTKSMQDELIAARGGAVFMTQNNIDFGVIPKDENNNNDIGFYTNFNYRSGYSFLPESKLFFYAKGRLSTQPEDSLNFLSIYPVNLNLIGNKGNFGLQIGVDGNQTFSNYRISGNLLWQGVIPNFLNFTMGADRLRLKPVLKAGVKFYQEMENNRAVTLNENQFSNQAFAELYYYIPVKDIYSLVIEVNSFYDFNDKVNPNNKVMFFYTATIGLEIPNSPIKTIFKYSKGANGINYQTDDQLTIGFMADLFGK